MKVVSAEIYVVHVDGRHPIVVRLRTDEGTWGLGEAAIAYGIGASAAAGMIRDLVERLILGRDPFRVEQLWSEMYDHSFWAKGGGPIVFAGISAIEQALWDIKGRALGLPVYELLGGRVFAFYDIAFSAALLAQLAKWTRAASHQEWQVVRCTSDVDFAFSQGKHELRTGLAVLELNVRYTRFGCKLNKPGRNQTASSACACCMRNQIDLSNRR